MSVVRSYVREQLAAKVLRHGVVIWDDPEQSYVDSASDLAPTDATFVGYDSSWYELRRRVEDLLSQSAPPRLVIHVPVEAPVEDPLAELRAATGLERSFRIILSTALKQALAGELPGKRLEEVIESARTLAEAEAILEKGGSGPIILTKALGTSEPTELTLRLATGEVEDSLQDSNVRAEATRFLAQHIGGDYGATVNLSSAVTRRLLASEILGAGIERDGASIGSFTSTELVRCSEVIARWKADRTRLSALRDRMSEEAESLGIDTLVWAPVLIRLDSAPVFDTLALHEYVRLSNEADHEEAAELAEVRLQGFWARWDHESTALRLWSVAAAAARLQAGILSAPSPSTDPAGILRQYESETWLIDNAHRQLDHGLTRLDALGDLEEVARAARGSYESWLDGYLRAFTSSVEQHGLQSDGLSRQALVHRQQVDPEVSKGHRVAYFFVDALRYELGRELAVTLQRAFGEDAVRVSGAIGAAPSITPVGMANLLPRADEALALSLDSTNSLVVTIDGTPVMTPADRLAVLQAAHGKVGDIVLDDLMTLGEADIEERLEGAKVVMVRSQEIDEGGESGKLAVAHTYFPIVLDHLRRAVAKLSHAGFDRFVMSSDHGFLILSRDLSQSRIIPKPGGKGEMHRRVFIGSGGTAGTELLRVPLSEVGIPGELDLLVPRGLGLISAGGSRGFFHGGLSPQELLVPVITVQMDASQATKAVSVEAAISGKITSEIFTAKLVLKSGLFAVDPLDVGVNAVRVSDGEEIARIVAAGGADNEEGLIRLSPDVEALLSFQVTRSLTKGDKVELRVMDVRTDRRLATSKPAQVATTLVVE